MRASRSAAAAVTGSPASAARRRRTGRSPTPPRAGAIAAPLAATRSITSTVSRPVPTAAPCRASRCPARSPSSPPARAAETSARGGGARGAGAPAGARRADGPGGLAFVPAGPGSGNLGAWMGAQGTGLAPADAPCQRSARSTGLPHPDSFHAWLSTSPVDAIDRLTIDGPWKRLDGVQIASSKADLGDGRLFSTITQDEYGEYRPGEVVWTGTLGDGTSSGETCSDWTNGTAASTRRSGTPTGSPRS